MIEVSFVNMASLIGNRKYQAGCALVAALFSVIYIAPVATMAEVVTDSKEEIMTEQFPKDDNSTIKCYQCNSWSDEGCLKVQVNDSSSSYLQECIGDFEGGVPFCRKTVQTIKNHGPRVIRSCGWKRHEEDCYHTDDDHHTENVCQCYKDACNEATRHGNVAFALLATLAALMTLV